MYWTTAREEDARQDRRDRKRESQRRKQPQHGRSLRHIINAIVKRRQGPDARRQEGKDAKK